MIRSERMIATMILGTYWISCGERGERVPISGVTRVCPPFHG